MRERRAGGEKFVNDCSLREVRIDDQGVKHSLSQSVMGKTPGDLSKTMRSWSWASAESAFLVPMKGTTYCSASSSGDQGVVPWSFASSISSSTSPPLPNSSARCLQKWHSQTDRVWLRVQTRCLYSSSGRGSSPGNLTSSGSCQEELCQLCMIIIYVCRHCSTRTGRYWYMWSKRRGHNSEAATAAS